MSENPQYAIQRKIHLSGYTEVDAAVAAGPPVVAVKSTAASKNGCNNVFRCLIGSLLGAGVIFPIYFYLFRALETNSL